VPALFRSAIALMRRSRCLPAAGFLLSGPVIFMLGCSIAQAAPGDPSAATLESRKAAGETTTRTCLASGFIQVNFFDKNGKLVSKLQSSPPCTPAKAGSDKATTDSLLASLLVTGDVTGLLGALLESARRELLDLLKNDPELNRLRRLYDNLNVSRSGLLEQIDELEAKKNRLLVYQDLVRGGRIDEQIAREKQKIEALKNNKDIGYLDRTRLLRRYKGNITELEYARNIAGTITNQLNEVSQEIADVERQGEQVLQQMDRAQKAFNDRADAINAEFRRTGGVSAGTSQFAPLRGGPGHASFRIDLDDLRSIAGRLNVSPTADFAPTPQETAPPPWNLWLQGEGTWFEDADAGAERSGAIFTLTAGASYLIDDGVTAGGFLSLDLAQEVSPLAEPTPSRIASHTIRRRSTLMPVFSAAVCLSTFSCPSNSVSAPSPPMIAATATSPSPAPPATSMSMHFRSAAACRGATFLGPGGSSRPCRCPMRALSAAPTRIRRERGWPGRRWIRPG